jgi:hypothetical protein
MHTLNKSTLPTENGGIMTEKVAILDAGAQYGKVKQKK